MSLPGLFARCRTLILSRMLSLQARLCAREQCTLFCAPLSRLYLMSSRAAVFRYIGFPFRPSSQLPHILVLLLSCLWPPHLPVQVVDGVRNAASEDDASVRVVIGCCSDPASQPRGDREQRGNIKTGTGTICGAGRPETFRIDSVFLVLGSTGTRGGRSLSPSLAAAPGPGQRN